MPKKIAFICFDKLQALDLFGPLEVFNQSRKKQQDGKLESNYETHILSIEGGEIATSSGVKIATEKFKPLNGFNTMIVVGGWGVYSATDNPNFCRYLQKSAKQVNRVVSICSGCFALAKAGLLENRTATGHWQTVNRLNDVSQDIQINSDAIYVKDDNVYTSAGICAGMDLTLALVEEDFGRDHAMQIAKYLVIYYRRSGGQSQFSEQLKSQTIVSDRFSDLCSYINNNLNECLNVSVLAERVNMSDRNFSRCFTHEVGESPGRYVEIARAKAAKILLEESVDSLQTIASKTGFSSAEIMRKSFLRRYGTTPSNYRIHFGANNHSL